MSFIKTDVSRSPVERKRTPERNDAPLNVLSLGAGVQSSAVLLMSIKGKLPPLDYVLFSDTGWEPAPVYEHLALLVEMMREAGIDFRSVGRERSIREDLLIQARGEVSRGDSPPVFVRGVGGKLGMLRKKCSTHYKARVLDKELTKIRRENGGARVRQWFGISADEIRRVRTSTRKAVDYWYPLAPDWINAGGLNWTRADCIKYLAAHDITAPKSACIGCPLRAAEEWHWLREHDPAGWADAIFVDREIRGGLPGSNAVETYLHRTGQPLDEVDIDGLLDRSRAIKEKRRRGGKQMSLFDAGGFDNDCSGLCGV